MKMKELISLWMPELAEKRETLPVDDFIKWLESQVEIMESAIKKNELWDRKKMVARFVIAKDFYQSHLNDAKEWNELF